MNAISLIVLRYTCIKQGGYVVASVFTKIISRELPAHIIYEDEMVIAFLDLNPVRPGHTIVIPKTEVDHIWDLPDVEYGHLMAVVQRLGGHLRTKLNTKRVVMVVQGFEVSHVHVHLIPSDTEFSLHDRTVATENLAQLAEELRLDAPE
jgi:diadenosine tetraphosphate (Ap4A) HIT family hydrolase